jgi:hypothetical protein
MKRALAMILMLAAVDAGADEAYGSIGTIRGDWSSPLNWEVDVELSALPVFDIAVGVAPFVNVGHASFGPRFEVLERRDVSGFSVKLSILLGAFANLGSPISVNSFFVNPQLQATYWFGRRFGITGAISVPISFPFTGSSVDFTPSAYPKLGAGFSF